MTQDEIIEIARLVAKQPDRIYAPDECEFLYYFAKLVAQHEREACAKVVVDLFFQQQSPYHYIPDARGALKEAHFGIRVRGDNK
jgi:hypothetical protein